MERNNKNGAGDRQKSSSAKRSGLSMEFKSKTLAASFTKSNDDNLDYDYEIPDEKTLEQDKLPSSKLSAGKENRPTVSADGVVDGGAQQNMDCLKNAAKAGSKVTEISSKTNWMKDKVSNFWARKGKQEDAEKPEVVKVESETKSERDSDGISAASDGKHNVSKSHIEEQCTAPINDAEIQTLETPAVEIKDSSKERKQGRASTGWIRDQVSSLISKGKNYASSTSTVNEAATNLDDLSTNSEESQLLKGHNLSQTISEKYTLKQQVEGKEEETSNQGAVTFGFDTSEKLNGETSDIEKDKFSDIHESMNKSIAKQMIVAFAKEENQAPQQPYERPSSPQVLSQTNNGGTEKQKRSSAKSKIKGFLTPRPLATDLTHIPLSPSSKDDKGKQGKFASVPTQTKKKFKFASKLTFSELLHSQERDRQVMQGNESQNADSLSTSPVLSRFESLASEDDEEKAAVDILESSSPNHLQRKLGASLTFFKLWSLALILYALFIIPMNSFIGGCVCGALVTYLIGCLVIWLFCPSGKSFEQYKQELQKYLKEQDDSPMLKKPIRSVDPDNLRKPRDLKGWVHFLLDYDPRVFTLDITKDVFAVLKGETLYILFCKPQADNKQATTPQKPKKMKRGLRSRRNKKQELVENQEPIFIFEKEHKISLSKCQLSLQPLDLPMRRIWNRKYPIRIDIPPGGMHTRDIEVPYEDLTSNLDEYFDSSEGEWSTSTSDEQFHIFPITAREKEDWFYRMQLCNKALKHQITFDDVRKGNLSSRAEDSYPHYMVECIRESEKITSRVVNGKRLEPHSAWLNVLLGRAFWDVWHEPYWKRKVWLKIQSRLSKLNTPPIIKEIYVKDLHLGHTLPVIHKGSLPELDEYGVWTDLQVTYQGEFTLTLETQLNVDYYVALLTKIVKQQTQAQDSAHVDVKMKVTREKTGGEMVDNGLASEGDSTDFEGVSVLQEQLPEMILEAIDDVEVDEVDLGAALDDDPMISDPRTKAFLESKTGKRVAGIVGWLARSKIAKRVAETDFAKKAYEKAYEKFRKMPIILKVTVQSLKGTLAVNIAPPPTNRLWFGFRGTPAVLLTAHPKLGDRHVRLTYLTDWIERKLKDEFKKLFVLPSMQDLSVKLMYSRLEELYPDRPFS